MCLCYLYLLFENKQFGLIDLNRDWFLDFLFTLQRLKLNLILLLFFSFAMTWLDYLAPVQLVADTGYKKKNIVEN